MAPDARVVLHGIQQEHDILQLMQVHVLPHENIHRRQLCARVANRSAQQSAVLHDRLAPGPLTPHSAGLCAGLCADVCRRALLSLCKLRARSYVPCLSGGWAHPAEEWSENSVPHTWDVGW